MRQELRKAPEGEKGIDPLGEGATDGDSEATAEASFDPPGEDDDGDGAGDGHRADETKEKADDRRDEHGEVSVSL